MGKVKYLMQRITHMNYGEFFKMVNTVHEKNHKNRIFIFFDIIHCGLKYQAGYVEYNLFEMYKMNEKERATVVTRGVNNRLVKQYNDPEHIYKFEDKAVFNKLFEKYLNREWIYLNEASKEDFKKYLKGKKEIVVKPFDQSCGVGVEKIKVDDYKFDELYKKLMDNKQYLVEDVAKQHKVINDIYPHSINTLRIVTLNKKVVVAFLRIGNHGNVVDNFCHDGMVTTIDVETGVIRFPATDDTGAVYDVHPMTKTPIVGTKIPMWDKAKKMCEEAAKVVPEIGYVGWDVCMGPDGPSIIEGNDFPAQCLYQLPVHRDNNIGLLPTFEKAMKGED